MKIAHSDSDSSHSKEFTVFSRIFCGRFYGQKRASAISHFFSSACGKG